MALLDKLVGKVLPVREPGELALAAELDEKFHYLDPETAQRLTDYRLYNDFYNGDQKQYRTPDPGRFNKEWNLCAPTVDTFTALMFGEAVKFTSVPDHETDLVEDVNSIEGEEEPRQYRVQYNRSEFIDKLYKKIFNEAFHVQVLRTEHNASKLGLGVLQFGWNRDMKRPFFASLYPGFCRFAWKSQDFSQLEFAFVSVPMSIYEVKRKYGIEVEKSEINASRDIPEMSHEAFNNMNKIPKVLVSHYFDSDKHVIKLGSRLIKQNEEFIREHKHGKVPLKLFLTRPTDDKPLGESDIKDGIPIQKDINATLSAWFDVTKSDEGTKIVVPGGNQQTMEALKKQGNVVVGSNREGSQPYILTREGKHPDIQARLDFLRGAFFQTVGLSQAFTSAPDTSVVTQVGINALNFPTLIRLKPRVAQRMAVLHEMGKDVLQMYEKFGGKVPNTNLTFAQVIDKHYDAKVRFEPSMPKDEAANTQMELFKLDRRIQSRMQTMSNLGIENPLEEMDQIAYEEHNPLYSPDRATEQRQLEMAENQQAMNSRPEEEVAGEAQQENQAMMQGQPVPVEQESPRDNQIHLTVHEPFLQQLQQQIKQVPPEQQAQVNSILQVIEQHINDHKTRLASLSGRGGPGQGAFGGRPEAQGAFNPPTAQGVQGRM